jgi:hypothetical protein
MGMLRGLTALRARYGSQSVDNNQNNRNSVKNSPDVMTQAKILVL